MEIPTAKTRPYGFIQFLIGNPHTKHRGTFLRSGERLRTERWTQPGGTHAAARAPRRKWAEWDPWRARMGPPTHCLASPLVSGHCGPCSELIECDSLPLSGAASARYPGRAVQFLRVYDLTLWRQVLPDVSFPSRDPQLRGEGHPRHRSACS